jgi:ribosomal protein S18 acetylase RimI-like enzyme
LLDNVHLLKYLKSQISDEEILSSYIFRASKGVYLYNLAVSKEYRGKGIAQRLIDIAMYVSKVKEYEYCHTSCENDISEHIFKKKGFKTEKNFTIGNGSTVRVMSSFI